MPFLSNIEQEPKKNALALKKLIQEIEHLKEETNKMFQEIGLCPDEFANYLQNPDNFTKDQWDDLQEHRRELNQKLSISHDANPQETKKARADLHMSRNWLFVK